MKDAHFYCLSASDSSISTHFVCVCIKHTVHQERKPFIHLADTFIQSNLQMQNLPRRNIFILIYGTLFRKTRKAEERTKNFEDFIGKLHLCFKKTKPM